MLASAPPLPTLKNTVECITLYTGVPTTLLPAVTGLIPIWPRPSES